MGSGYFINCESCTYQKEFLIGVGMSHGSLENIILSTNKNDQKKIKEILSQDKNINLESNGYSIFQCEKCFYLSNKFHIQLKLNKKSVFNNNPDCKKCNVRMKKINIDENLAQLKTIKNCPKCKSEKILTSESMLWD